MSLFSKCLQLKLFNSHWKVIIANNLSEEEIKGLRQMFDNMDTDRSGTITYEELKSGLTRLGSRLNEAEIKQLMDAVSGVIKQINFPSFFLQLTSLFSLVV